MGLLKKEKCGVFSSQNRKDYSLLSTERDKELFREKTIEEEAFFFAEMAICFQLLQHSTIEYFDSRVAAAINLLIMDQKCHQLMMHNMLLA